MGAATATSPPCIAPPRPWRPEPNTASNPPAPKNDENRSEIEPKLSKFGA
jgi:hypothetical protein